YLSDRQLPDKAVSVLDTACARLALGQSATPARVEAARRTLDDLDSQARILRREMAVGEDHSARLLAVSAAPRKAATDLDQLTARWDRERDLVSRIRQIRDKLESSVAMVHSDDVTMTESAAAQPTDEKLRTELEKLTDELERVQGEDPLVPVCVDHELVG